MEAKILLYCTTLRHATSACSQVTQIAKHNPTLYSDQCTVLK